jgi:hypothetical protein
MSDAFQLPFTTREERIAHNEAWSRSLNERRAEWVSGRSEAMGFRCECWQADCSERIQLSPEDWTMVRAQPNRFAVAPRHVARHLEAVVKQCDGFWMIEKFGKAGEVSEELASAASRAESSGSDQ